MTTCPFALPTLLPRGLLVVHMGVVPGAPCRHPRVLCDLRLFASRTGIHHNSLAGSNSVARFRTSKPIETKLCVCARAWLCVCVRWCVCACVMLGSAFDLQTHPTPFATISIANQLSQMTRALSFQACCSIPISRFLDSP